MSVLSAVNNMVKNEFLIDTSVSFSEKKEIEEIQKKAEALRIYQGIKNIVNAGKPNKDDAGKVEWESCIITYQPVDSKLIGGTKSKVLANITMSDGTTLYESLFKSNSFTRYTEIFRFGKWVSRLLQHSEDLSAQYQLEIENRKKELQERLLKPFSDIDF